MKLLFMCALLFVLHLQSTQAFVCDRQCRCQGATLDCTHARGVKNLADLSATGFQVVRLPYSDVKSLNCSNLSPKLHLLDIRGTKLTTSNICRLYKCEKIERLRASVSAEQCRKLNPTTVVSPSDWSGSPNPGTVVSASVWPGSPSSTDASTAPSTMKPQELSSCDFNYYKSLGVGLGFSLLGAAWSLASFCYFRYKLRKQKQSFRNQIHLMFGEQERRFGNREVSVQVDPDLEAMPPLNRPREVAVQVDPDLEASTQPTGTPEAPSSAAAAPASCLDLVNLSQYEIVPLAPEPYQESLL